MKLDLAKYEAVIFDMDGTMIENTSFHNKAWVEFCKRQGLSFTEEEVYSRTAGRQNKAILEVLLERKIDDAELEKLERQKEEIYRKIYKPEFKEVSGLKDFLHYLSGRNIKVGIATNAPLQNRVFVLETLELQDFFAVVVGSEHVKLGKPHPEIYLTAAEGLSVDPNKCLAFEDTRGGIASAKAAGMTVVGMLTTHTKEELNEADYFIKDFTEIDRMS